jgi:hypothetical protein
MIFKNINEITLDDIKSLIANEVGENKSLEYKSELNIASGDERKEFLADISSFANADGGDIIYGIKEDDNTKLPSECNGINIQNEDELIRQIESLLRDSISPRITDIEYKTLHLEKNKYMLVIRIGMSYLMPHRVIYKGWDKFFSRNSKGKYPLDVNELRTAFTMSQTLIKSIDEYIAERIVIVAQNRNKELLENRPIFLMQLIPLVSFRGNNAYSMTEISRCVSLAGYDNSVFYNNKINIEGITFSNKNEILSQYVFHKINGIIEMATTNFFFPNYEQQNRSPRVTYNVVSSRDLLDECFKFIDQAKIYYKYINISSPIVVTCAIINGKDYELPIGIGVGLYNRKKLDSDLISTPSILINNFNRKTQDILKPTLDSIWNAFGKFYCSAYNKETGEYVGFKDNEVCF